MRHLRYTVKCRYDAPPGTPTNLGNRERVHSRSGTKGLPRAEGISMNKSKSFFKQAALCIWIGLTVYVWFTLNVPEYMISRAPSIISQTMLKTHKLVWPYVYRQYIFVEKDSKEGK